MIFNTEFTRNCLSAGLCPDWLEEFTLLHRSLAGFGGPDLRTGKEYKRKEGKGMKEENRMEKEREEDRAGTFIWVHTGTSFSALSALTRTK